ncbi:MAG: hypothetical protein Q8N81_02825, partial [bacterium]|nr:hypothetical protein [bacterium]
NGKHEMCCKSNGHMHKDMWGCCGSMHKFSFLRLILFLFILAFVFWGGVKLGELKSEFYGYYGGAAGMHGRYFIQRDGFGPGMMWNNFYQRPTSTNR